MSTDLIVDLSDNPKTAKQPASHEAMVQYVMGYVDDWKNYRDTNFSDDWNFYWRMWKGIWNPNDKGSQSEKSKLVSPALQQAIELQVAEQEEATFGRKNWFDISDDILDQHKEEMEALRDQLLEDMEQDRVPEAVIETYLNGAIYGTGIAKIVVDQVPRTKLTPQGEAVTEDVVRVSLVPILPEEFVIDPAADSVESALGCAHDTIKPRHEIEKKKQNGLYYNHPLGAYTNTLDVSGKGESKYSVVGDDTRITEYHGLVPQSLLTAIEEEDIQERFDEEVELIDLSKKDDIYEEELVESIVTIANGSVLMRAIANPFLMKDRSIIAYPHDKVPNRFWGRGVAEKGANVQRALDAELRARIDGLALTIHPMMGVDGTRLPRGANPKVAAGRTVVTNGNPRDILMPFNFGNINSQTFAQSGELERMIQMATGSMDSATGTGSVPRNNTASGMSMIQASAAKRTKRVMRNISSHFLNLLVRKMAWRYMQYDNERYPIDDYNFVPRTTMGIMAREFEQAQMTNLLTMIPPGSPVSYFVLKKIIDNGSGEDKEDLKKLIEQVSQPQGPTEEQQMEIRLSLEKLEAEIEEIRSRAAMNEANAERSGRDSMTGAHKAATARLKVTGEIQDKELDRASTDKDNGDEE